MAQLVGQNCVHCEERIANELDAHFCEKCGSPVHNRCLRPGGDSGCPACGAAVSIPTPPPPVLDTTRPEPEQKNTTLAFTLNFFLPGAGLWYLGWWGWGLLNLAVVLTIGVAASLAMSEDDFERNRRYLAAMCSGGSGGLAMGLANRWNALRRTNRSGDESRHPA